MLSASLRCNDDDANQQTELFSRIKLQTPVWRCSGSPKGPSTCRARSARLLPGECHPGAPEGFAEIASTVFGIDTSKMDRLEAAEAALDRIEYFRNIVGIDDKACTLSTYGLTEKDCKHMAKNSINDLCNEGSARDWTEEDSFEVYMSMM